MIQNGSRITEWGGKRRRKKGKGRRRGKKEEEAEGGVGENMQGKNSQEKNKCANLCEDETFKFPINFNRDREII